jgi:hypothetical protein
VSGRNLFAIKKNPPPPSALKMEAAVSAETLVNFYQTTRRQSQKFAVFIVTVVRTPRSRKDYGCFRRV